MTRHGVRAIVIVGLTLLLPLTLGCGGGPTKPRGRLLMNGQPVTLSDKGVLQVAFIPEPSTGTSYPALVKPDGTFEVPGVDKKGIPPGKYKVSVRLIDPYPTTDKLGGKYAQDKTTIIKQIPGDDLTIDVGK